MWICRDRSKKHIEVDQSGYIRSILDCFGMADANPHPTPLPTGANVHLIKNTTQATQAEVTVLFPGPCTCAIIQYLSPKLQTAITHSILNQFFSFLGFGLTFLHTT